MSPPKLQLRGLQSARLSRHYRMPLGRILVDMGVMTAGDVLRALAIQGQCKAPLHQVLLAEEFASAEEILQAQAAQHAAISLVLAEAPPEAGCAGALDPLTCLEHGVMPWIRLGGTLVLATCHPERFEAIRALLPPALGPVVMGIATEADIHAAIAQCHAPRLTELAETGLPAEDSCRSLRAVAAPRQLRRMALAALVVAGAVAALPMLFYGLAAGWAVLTLAAVLLLKLATLLARLTAPGRRPPPVAAGRAPLPGVSLPRVSLLVPLYRETRVATRLVARLSRLAYPKPCLEVLLLLEAEDMLTRKALCRARLPPWMRLVVVPPGALTTKPRALNYGLRFCDGEIIGVYDAEDNPAPDQIDLVAARFRTAPSEVACLQGILDFYNPCSNWLARCFTIEYASWFRITLPGLARLGLVLPLGGTTLFCRRAVLETIGGWDAHNVTEDADLGVRLARRGFRVEMLDSVTLEEANCRPWPWIRQRSRWLKGYVVTYLVHMRRPAALLRDLGLWRFCGFQVLFLAAISQFILAPVLWSFWIALLGLPHPLIEAMPPGAARAVLALFLLTECCGLILGACAVASPQHRRLLPWLPTLLFYFPMASVAIYKGLVELLLKPFYWDKTEHGHSNGERLRDHDTATARP